MYLEEHYQNHYIGKQRRSAMIKLKSLICCYSRVFNHMTTIVFRFGSFKELEKREVRDF